MKLYEKARLAWLFIAVIALLSFKGKNSYLDRYTQHQNHYYKLHYLTNKLNFLHRKYGILSKASFTLLKKPFSKVNAKNRLAMLERHAMNIPILLPMNKARVTSPYGMRKHPIRRKLILHKGIDLVGDRSKVIYAAASGVVTRSAYDKGYGNLIEIKHSNSISTKYAHLSKLHVRKGGRVIKGQRIGVEGKTGRTSGSHLHFEVILKGRPVNPADFIF